MKILLIGPRTNIENGLVGGATISFGHLVDFMKRKGESVRVINTKRYFGSFSSARNIFQIISALIRYSFWADVIFLNSSRGGTKYLAPIIFVFSRLFGSKFIFRPFGGDMKDYIRDYSSFAKKVFAKTVLKADILYLQTQGLLDYFGKGRQLKTSRARAPLSLSEEKPYAKKFIFIGFIHEDKGVDYLLEASEILGEEYTIHLYGPIKMEKYKTLSSKHYKGVLASEDILPTISKYDVLVLPTFYEGEGYPGVIIEAYSVGIPVISTDWKSIPEIVKNNVTGILVAPKSKDELLAAIRSFDRSNYDEFTTNALKYFNDTFDEEKVLSSVIQDIYAL